MPRSLALLVLLVSPLAAAEPAIKGTFGFDWLRPEKSSCAEVKGALLAKLERRYRCAPPETESASGAKVVAVCKAKQGRSEVMLFASAAACREERETQLANGD
jgi:hypothetical protein